MVGDIILVVALLIYGVFGFFLMGRLDKFLDENRKRRHSDRDYDDEEEDH